MAGVIPDLSEQITRLIHYLDEVKNLTGYDGGLQAEINNFEGTLSTNLSYLKISLPHTVSTEAIGLLGNEVAEANRFVGECLEQDKFRRIWSARNTRTTLESLRQKLVSSFHLAFFITSLDVAIEGQTRTSDFQERMLILYNAHVSDASAARAQIQNLLQPLASELKRQDKKLEKLVEFVERGGTGSTSIETDQSTDTQKFFADVLATVEQLQSNEDDRSDSSDVSMEDFIYDPLTKAIMVDPVKGSDGITYDRWTIINQDLLVSPFTRDSLSIVCEDINLRRWLFAKFQADKLEDKYNQLREDYRRITLELAREGHYGEALERLEHVLKWAPKDSECQELRREVSSRLQKLQSHADSTSSVFLGSNRNDPADHALAADGPDRVAATEFSHSLKFDETPPRREPSCQRDPKAGSETSLGSGFVSISDREGAGKFDSSIQPDSSVAQEARIPPRPNIRGAAKRYSKRESLDRVDGEARTGASTGPNLSSCLAEVPNFGSSAPTETVLARKSTASSQSDVVVSVCMESLPRRGLEGGIEASSQPRRNHDPPEDVEISCRSVYRNVMGLLSCIGGVLRVLLGCIVTILRVLLAIVLFPILILGVWIDPEEDEDLAEVVEDYCSCMVCSYCDESA